MSAPPKRVLVIYFSQTGQLTRIARFALASLAEAPGVEVTWAEIPSQKPFPFPWPALRFFDTFPETVYEDIDPIELNLPDTDQHYDLIVLAYQVWFLTPSLPVTAFLKSEQAAKLFKGARITTLIGCRNMWLMAQERMKEQIVRLGGTLIDNVVLTDDAHSAFTFISTPLWMLTGDRGPFFFGLVPSAGVPDAEIIRAKRFGTAILNALITRDAADTRPMLQGLGAVKINADLIPSERIAQRSFKLWAGLLRSVGKPGGFLRTIVLLFYITFLITLILTVVPLSAIIRKTLQPLNRNKTAREKAYFALPSGESSDMQMEASH